MGRKIATIAAVTLIASTATIGCGSTIQKVSGTINNMVQTDEFANAADSISNTVWGLMTTVADAVCDFCKNAFGDGDTSKPETPDAGSTSTEAPDSGSSEAHNTGTTESSGAGSTEMAVAGGTDTSSTESSGEAQTKPAESEENKD